MNNDLKDTMIGLILTPKENLVEIIGLMKYKNYIKTNRGFWYLRRRKYV